MKSKKGFALSVLFVFFIFGVTIPLFMSNHRKVKADSITDLTSTTWIINDNPSTFPSGRDFTNYYNDETDGPYYINFTSNDINFTSITFISDEDIACHMRYNEGDTRYWVLTYGDSNNDTYVWLNNNYKTIEITGGTDTTNADLIAWFETNATQYTPTPTGTRILYKYWAPDGIIRMQDNQRIGDNDIQYTVLFNEYNRSYDETTQTGLIFTGVMTEQEPAWSYIESINGTGINILYHGETNNINNTMWLEFTYGDYMDTNLYNFMDLWGYWFDDAEAYITGMNQGYVEGVEHGRALGQADGVEYTGLITGIFNGLGNILSIQVFPNITIGLLIGLPLLLGAFIIIIKILRG